MAKTYNVAINKIERREDMSKNLNEILKSLNKSKVQDLIKKAENGGLSDLLNSIDKEKAEKLISQMGLSDKIKNSDIEKVINDAKNNPEIIDKIKDTIK